LTFNEKGDYAGSTGVTIVGQEPDDMTYDLSVGPHSVTGAFFKVDLDLYSYKGGWSRTYEYE